MGWGRGRDAPRIAVTAHTVLPATGPRDTAAAAGSGAMVVLAGAALLLVATRQRNTLAR